MTNAPEDFEQIRDHLARALKLIDNRAPDYKKAREFYEGRRAEVAGSSALESIVKSEGRSPISFAHIPVDVVADKVQVSGLTAIEEPAQVALREWLEASGFEDEHEDWIRKAGYFGDYYVVVDPTEEEEAGEDRTIVPPSAVEAVGMSPLSTVMVYDSKTGRRALYGVHVWEDGEEGGKPITRGVLYYDDMSVKVVSSAGGGNDAKTYSLDLAAGEDEDAARVAHDGDAPLLKHLAVGGKPYGVPLHLRAWGFQDAITKVSANNLANVDAQGLPSRWALMDPVAEIDDDIDDDFGSDGPTTAAGKGDGQKTPTAGKVRTPPGAITMLRGVKAVGTFDNSGSDDFLKNLDWYVRGMAVACGVPLFEFDLSGNQPSGESRRRAESRVNRRARSVQRTVAAFVEDLARMVCALAGIAEATPSVSFEPVETATDAEGLELVAAKMKQGVPARVALLEAGYAADQVDEWFPEGDTARLAPSLLAVIADILQKLGQAQTLGAITAEEIRDMLPDVLTQARDEGVPSPVPPVEDEPGGEE